jgi:hypothetical protein
MGEDVEEFSKIRKAENSPGARTSMPKQYRTTDSYFQSSVGGDSVRLFPIRRFSIWKEPFAKVAGWFDFPENIEGGISSRFCNSNLPLSVQPRRNPTVRTATAPIGRLAIRETFSSLRPICRTWIEAYGVPVFFMAFSFIRLKLKERCIIFLRVGEQGVFIVQFVVLFEENRNLFSVIPAQVGIQRGSASPMQGRLSWRIGIETERPGSGFPFSGEGWMGGKPGITP